MNRRDFFAQFSYFSALAYSYNIPSVSYAVELFSSVDNPKVNQIINDRINGPSPDYMMVLKERPEILSRIRSESPNLLLEMEASLAKPELIAFLDKERIKGLMRLKDSNLSPKVKVLLLDLKLEQVLHEVATCLDHFLGVYEILSSWGHPREVALMGLFHAVYGTAFNQIQVLSFNSLTDRELLRKSIGNSAEKLTYLYGITDTPQLLDDAEKNCERLTSVKVYGLDKRVMLKGNELNYLSDCFVANSWEPFQASGDESLLSRVKKFKSLNPYLSIPARNIVAKSMKLYTK